MISESVIEILPIFDGFVSGTTVGTPFVPLQFEPIKRQHAGTLSILDLLKEIVKPGVGGYSFKTHDECHW